MRNDASVSPKGRDLTTVNACILGFAPDGQGCPEQRSYIAGALHGTKPSSDPITPEGNGQGPWMWAAFKSPLRPEISMLLKEIDRFEDSKVTENVARAQEETKAGEGC